MRIVPIPQDECKELLKRVSFGHLACSLNDQPYVVPVGFAYDGRDLYLFSTAGKKIDWMRQNPKICLQADEIGSRSNWSSVIVNGKFVELREPQYTEQKQYARERLAQYSDWWQTPMAERREQMSDLSIEPVFIRLEIEEMSGLRSVPEAS
jgi:nitroimidazol reductase NimA-like FMN-containing flavoprotein (pyridoxamine 5'-phosphate oxidase superfamily)